MAVCETEDCIEDVSIEGTKRRLEDLDNDRKILCDLDVITKMHIWLSRF